MRVIFLWSEIKLVVYCPFLLQLPDCATGWLSIKHQVTYSLTVLFFSHMDCGQWGEQPSSSPQQQQLPDCGQRTHCAHKHGQSQVVCGLQSATRCVCVMCVCVCACMCIYESVCITFSISRCMNLSSPLTWRPDGSQLSHWVWCRTLCLSSSVSCLVLPSPLGWCPPWRPNGSWPSLKRQWQLSLKITGQLARS